MSVESNSLKFQKLWLAIGYSLVAFVIYSSLTSITVEVDVPDADKYAHTLAYFVLMGWFVQLYHTKRNIFICGISFIVMGVGLEFIQGMTGYRYFDLYDMVANVLGVLIAWVLTLTGFPLILTRLENRLKIKNM